MTEREDFVTLFTGVDEYARASAQIMQRRHHLDEMGHCSLCGVSVCDASFLVGIITRLLHEKAEANAPQG